MADRELMKLVRRVDELERMSLAQNLPQMAQSSIEDGFVEEYTAEGTVASRIGRQEDGTHAPTTLSGPTPPTPAGITAEGGQLTASLTWDGSYSDSLVSMMDFSRAEVHGSTDSPDFTPDPLPASSTRIATIETAGGASVTFAAAAGTLYLKVIVRSLAGRWSDPSEVVSVEVAQAVDPEVFDQLQTDLGAAQSAIDQAQTDLTQAQHDLYEPGGTVDLVKTTLTGEIASGDANTLGAAAADATSKADAAKAAATAAAATDAQAKADAAKAAATAAAATDAQTKADAAQAAAIAAAAVTAQLEADGAKQDAIDAAALDAQTKADAAKAAALAAAALDAQAKADAAQAAATSAASADATTKANAAKQAAIDALSPAISGAQTAATNAMTAAQQAQATADGAISTYYQDTAPWANGSTQPASKLGDMWYKSSTNQAYRWDGSTWQLIADTSITAALAAAQNAQATADGKITAYYQATQPTTGDVNDLWFDTGHGNKPYYCSKVSPLTWTAIQDAAITAAQTAADAAAASAAVAQTTASGKNSVQWATTPPGAPVVRTNLATNPNFSADISGWVAGGGATLARDTGESLDPLGCLSISGSSSTNDCFVYDRQNLSNSKFYPGWSVGKTYTISADAILGAPFTGSTFVGRVGVIYVTIYMPSGTKTYVSQPATTSKSRISVVVPIPPDATGGSFRLYNGSKNSGDVVYWDNILVEEADEAKPYFDGATSDPASGVTYAWTGTPDASTSTASAITANPGTKAGDVWYQYKIVSNKTTIIGMWRWSGSAWVTSPLDETFLPQVNIGTGTYGELDGLRLKANSVQANTVVVAGSVTNTLIKGGDITADKLNIQSVTAAVATIIQLDVGQLTVTGTSNFSTAVVDKMFANIFAAHQITADEIDAADIAAAVGTFVKVDANNVNFDEATGKVMTVGNAVLGDGIRTYATGSSGDQYVNVQLGVPGEADIVGVKDEDGNTVASMDGSGTVAGSVVQSDQDILVGGSPLVGTLVSPGSDTDQVQRTNWLPTPQDFEGPLTGSTTTTNGSASLSTAQHYSGTQSMALTQAAATAGSNIYFQMAGSTFGLSSGDPMVLSGWVYIPATVTTNYNSNGVVGITGGGTTSAAYAAVDWSKRDQWQYWSCTTTYDGSGNMNPTFYAPAPGQTVYFDDVMWETGSTPTTFFSGSTPAAAYSYKYFTVSGFSVAQEYIPVISTGYLDGLSRGISTAINFRNLSTISGTVTSGNGNIGQVNIDIPPGRAFEFRLPWRLLPTKQAGTSPTELSFSVRAFYQFTTDGTEPATPGTSEGEVIADSSQRTGATATDGVSGILTFSLNSITTVTPLRLKILLVVHCGTNTSATPSLFAPFDWIAYVHDHGPTAPLIDAVPSGSKSAQNFITTWSATQSRTYQDNGSYYAPDGTLNMRQGVDEARTHTYWAAFVCNGAGTGGETKTIPQALTGATITKVEVWLTLTYTEEAKGQAKIRPLNSKTLPATLASPSASSKAYTTAPDITRGSGRWVTVPNTYISATNTGFILATPDWLFANSHIVASGSGDTADKRAKVRVTYSRTL